MNAQENATAISALLLISPEIVELIVWLSIVDSSTPKFSARACPNSSRSASDNDLVFNTICVVPSTVVACIFESPVTSDTSGTICF